MAGLDDLIGSLQKAQTGGGGGGGGGLGDILGDVLGGSGGGGGLGDILGSVLGGGGNSATRSGGSAGNAMAMLAPIIASLLANGGLEKILGSLRANGLSSQADSWVSKGDNESIDPSQVTQALGGEVSQIADQLGIDHDQASQLLAQVLPGLVDKVTPDGSEPANDELDRLADALKGLGPTS